MSDFAPALSFVLDNEDALRKYAIVPDPGGSAIAGVNSYDWPAQYDAIAGLPQADRASAVASFYQMNFWNPINCSGIADQDIANRVMDESVNGGLDTGPKILQRAANSCGAMLAVDGEIGPMTLAAVNGIDAATLLAAYRAARVAHYQAIAAANPADAKYLAAWVARAEK